MHPQHRLNVVFLAIFLLGVSFSVSSQTQLNFSLLVINGEQRTAYLNQILAFEKEYPDIKVNIKAFGSDDYKNNIESWLTAESYSDVIYWFSGERLNWFVSRGWVHDIDDIWSKHQFDQRITASAKSTVVINGKKYGLPIHYYHWGIYYNRTLFAKYGLNEPQTWEEFLSVCETLKQHRITPIAFGAKETWPVAAWFDYINLRINGLAFHKGLMNGKISYHDVRLKPVFEYLATLVDNQYFLVDYPTTTWKEALPYLYHDMAGMFFMGNFWTSQIPKSFREKISFFKFPIINRDLPNFEEAPTNILFIPKNVKNEQAAELFLDFMSRPDVQSRLNESLGMLAPQVNSQQKMDPYQKAGAELLQQSHGASQYFDRDSPQPIATEGMKQIANFMKNTTLLPSILDNLDALRDQSFPKEK